MSYTTTYITRYNVNAPYNTDEYEYNNFVFQYESGLLYEQPDTPYGGATSSPNSTLLSELNRLANGGTYRSVSQLVGEALAAKQWALRIGITPYSTNTVGVLNEIASIESRSQWLDYSGVCNYIAGTAGLPAAAALRRIEF